MDCVARREEFPTLAKLFVDSFGGTEQFAMSVLENFAGEGNVFAARQDGACTALLCAVPVTLCGRKGAYYYGLTTRPDQRGTGVMTTLMDAAGQELARRGAAFAALIPANAPLFDFYAKRGFEKAFSKRVLRQPVRNNLWAQAEFDTVTAKGLQQLRRKYAPNAVELNEGYGLFFKKGNEMRFVELFAESDRAAVALLEAARQKTSAEDAVLELGESQMLFLGEGAARDYGMIRFFDQPFDVRDAYMRLMLDDE